MAFKMRGPWLKSALKNINDMSKYVTNPGSVKFGEDDAPVKYAAKDAPLDKRDHTNPLYDTPVLSKGKKGRKSY